MWANLAFQKTYNAAASATKTMAVEQGSQNSSARLPLNEFMVTAANAAAAQISGVGTCRFNHLDDSAASRNTCGNSMKRAGC